MYGARSTDCGAAPQVLLWREPEWTPMPLARHSSACAVAITLLLTALPVNAGPEVQANTFTQGTQFFPAIAKLANGYIVVWASDGQDGSGYGIYGQRYTQDGAKIGAELHISETTAGDQTRPR